MRKKLGQLIAIFLLAALTLSGCGANGDGAKNEVDLGPVEPGYPIEIKHSGGVQKLNHAPKKIVVLNMAALDTIDALGGGDLVAGTVVQYLPTWLKDDDGVDYSKKTDVGSFFEPNLEAIAKINPDLVITGQRSGAFYHDLAARYPTIDMSVDWRQPGYSERNAEIAETIAKAIGKEKEGKKIAAQIRKHIDYYKKNTVASGRALVVMSSGGEVSLHGPQSRWAPIFEVFGFEPGNKQAADEGHKGMKVSFEAIQALNPDWIFVVDRDIAIGRAENSENAREVMNNELVNSTTAAKKNQIVYLQPESWYMVLGGARNFMKQLDEVAELTGTPVIKKGT